jgi:hypothetical protein
VCLFCDFYAHLYFCFVSVLFSLFLSSFRRLQTADDNSNERRKAELKFLLAPLDIPSLVEHFHGLGVCVSDMVKWKDAGRTLYELGIRYGLFSPSCESPFSHLVNLDCNFKLRISLRMQSRMVLV